MSAEAAKSSPTYEETMINNLLAKALQTTPVIVQPTPNSTDWQITHLETSDGKKIPTAVLSISDGNGINLFWFPLDVMKEFTANCINVNTALELENRKLNRLLVPGQASGLIIPQSGQKF